MRTIGFAACCRVADGCGYPLQGSMPQQKQQRQEQHQQQPRDSGGTFLAKYVVQAATTRSLHEHGHAGRQRHQQQLPRGSDRTFPAEFAAQAATLGLYTNADTPDTAHQLDAEAVPAEVAHIRTNTQPSCSGGGESDRVLQGGHVRFTPSYIVTLSNAPIMFKVRLQGLTAQSTMEAELVAAALTM